MTDPTSSPARRIDEQEREWLANVYKGDDVPQLTFRAVFAGMLFGGLMSLSNLYIGLKSGWGLGVDIAAVIVIFAVFRGLQGLGVVKREFGMMENTITMTTAVAASWISSAGLVSAVPALTMLTGYTFVWWQLVLYIGVILFLGLFMAIPLKRQMIQVDHLRFPANIPTGETLKAMYSQGGEAMKKAKALGTAGGLGVVVAALRDKVGWIPAQFQLPFAIGGVPLGKLTLSLEPSLIFIGIGALFGIKVGLSMLLGLVLNYAVLAPELIESRIIRHPAPEVQAAAAPVFPLARNAGDTFTVIVEEADRGPELAAGGRTETLTYVWTAPALYGSTSEIARDLGAPCLLDGTPNPFGKRVRATVSRSRSLGVDVLSLDAPAAVTWESRITVAENQPEGIPEALGFQRGATRMQPVGGFRNISAWSL